MAKIQVPTDITKITDPDEFMRFQSKVTNDIGDAINGGLEFDHNLKTQHVTVDFKIANADTAVSHSFNRTGIRYLVAEKSASCDIYTGTTTATKKTIYLRSTVAPVTVTLILY